MTHPILFSGIQPSGKLILGNYLGMMLPSLALQATHQCYFPIVDLHSLTVKQDPDTLREQCYELLALYIACGFDPEAHTLFIQSHVPAHAELMWLLNCLTGMGELNRMTQFKDKSERHQHNVNAGLFTYPTLMAADILLYQTAVVPVGEDQKQHLELARTLAQRFNHHYGPTFTVPEPMIAKQGARIMSLQDPTKKMSKSDDNPANVIYLTDTPKDIERKCKRAVTDSENAIRYAPDTQPGVANLMSILALCTNQSLDALEKTYEGQGYGALKKDTAEAVIELLKPIQARYDVLIQDRGTLGLILQKGRDHATKVAAATLGKAKKAMGLITLDHA